MPGSKPLEGKVALVAVATRGAGRGIACMLGEAGATVICTGHSVRGRPSTPRRPETIDDNARMVTEHGGVGITDQGGGTFFYGFVKESVMRIAELLAPELVPHGIAAVSLTPGLLRSAAVLERVSATESN